jgi:hypothetical protein
MEIIRSQICSVLLALSNRFSGRFGTRLLKYACQMARFEVYGNGERIY